MKRKGINFLVKIAVVLVALVIALPACSTTKTEKLFSIGERYLEELDYERAIFVFEEIIETEPAYSEAYINLYKAYAALGNEEMAVKTLERGYANTNNIEIYDLLEAVKHPKVDFTKLDAWFANRWEEESNILYLTVPSRIDNKIYYIRNDDSGYGAEEEELWQYDVINGNAEKLFGFKELLPEHNEFSYCVANEKVYVATNPNHYEYHVDYNTGYAHIFCYDIKTKELKMLRDDLEFNPHAIIPVSDGLIVVGASFDAPAWEVGYYNTIIDFNGKTVVEINNDFDIEKFKPDIMHIGCGIVTDGNATVACNWEEDAIYKLDSMLTREKILENIDYGEIAALDNNKVFYHNHTGSQCYTICIDYIKYLDLSSGEQGETNIDVHYNDYNMIGVLSVMDEMVYAVYTNIDVLEGKKIYGYLDFEPLETYCRDCAELDGFPESEGYYFYLYRFNMETGEYTLVAQ